MEDHMSGRGTADKPRVLVVDDEVAIADLVVSLLAAEGIGAHACYDAQSALSCFAQGRFDLAILDIMMPDMDGFELCARLQAITDVSVMFLSARDEEADQVVGFALGADDYVVKPFKPRELVARVRARLRRAASARRGDAGRPSESEVLAVRGIEIDLRAHAATLHGQALSLTPKEFSILALLARNAGSPVSTRDIFEGVWNERYDSAAANTVMVHIRHVRKKLAAVDSSETFIETAWGVGYRLRGDLR